jgi:hypothetical protein
MHHWPCCSTASIACVLPQPPPPSSLYVGLCGPHRQGCWFPAPHPVLRAPLLQPSTECNGEEGEGEGEVGADDARRADRAHTPLTAAALLEAVQSPEVSATSLTGFSWRTFIAPVSIVRLVTQGGAAPLLPRRPPRRRLRPQRARLPPPAARVCYPLVLPWVSLCVLMCSGPACRCCLALVACSAARRSGGVRRG